MNINEIFFLLAFFGMIAIIFLKLYNVFSLGKFYNIKIAVLSFAGYFIFWLLSFVVFVTNPEITLYNILYNFGTFFILFNLGLFIAEIIMNMAESVDKSARNSVKYLQDIKKTPR
jgi:hypothetical protein